MASILLFFLSTLLLSHHTHARDAQFFTKVPRTRNSSSPTTITHNEVQTLNKNNQQFTHKQPSSLPQTTQPGYGLYGHETGLNPPATLTTHMEKHNYASELNGLSFNGFTHDNNEPAVQKHKDESYYKEEDEGVGYYGGVQKQGITNQNNYYKEENEGARYYGGVEKQGISDTRFFKNGKYFYDINGENKYFANPNYRGRNYNSNYENNYNNYEDFSNNYNGNSMQRYPNQDQEEEEFDFHP